MLDEAGLDELSLEALAWLWQVLLDDPGSAAEVEAIRRHINNRAVETAGAANFTTSYGDEAYLLLHSNRRTDAIILDALIADDPESDLIPKVVNGLLAHRTRGAGATPRRTSLSCWRWTATSTPMRRRRRTSWRASGWATPTSASTPSRAAPPSGTRRRSPWPTWRRRRRGAGPDPEQGGPGGSTTAWGCATRPPT